MNPPGPSSSGAPQEASERAARERAVVALLRQLWLALSTYRLYPEDHDRPGFSTGVERVGAAAREALAGGAVDVQIRGNGFVLDDRPLAGDDPIERLAIVCFERRAERLRVTAVPDASDLERLFSVLTRPAGEVEEAGGAERLLRDAGVNSLSLSPIGPGRVEGSDHAPPGSAPASSTDDAGALASELMGDDLRGSPAEQAQTLLERLRTLSGPRPTGAPEIDLHASVHGLMQELSADVRRSLVDMLVERVREDPVAERVIGTMSNAELTRALVDLGAGGQRDPVELARRLAAAGARQIDIVDLTRALETGQEDAGTIIAGLEQLGIDLGDEGAPAPGDSVMEVLSHYLSATGGDDTRSIRAAMSASGAEMRAAQVMAVADYVTLETDRERAGEALEIWSEELRRALGDRDEREVASQLRRVRDVLVVGGDDGGSQLFQAYVRRVLVPEVVLRAVGAEAAAGHPRLAALLSPFGDAGVEVLLDLLAEEQDRGRRALLLGALRRIAAEHPEAVVSRLRDDRWFVVRNAISILGSASNPAVLTQLAEAARHPAEAVRREVPEALANAGGPGAAPHLVRIALEGGDDLRHLAVSSLGTIVGEEPAAGLAEVAMRASDRAIAMQALEELGKRPEGAERLGHLLSGRDGRLPWRLRRHARRLLARLERNAPPA